MILIKENAPSPASLGQSNGIVQFAMCSARSFAPFLVRWDTVISEDACHVLILACAAPYLPCPSITISLEGICGLSSWLSSHTSVQPFPAKSRSTARKPSLDHPVRTSYHFMTSHNTTHDLYPALCFGSYLLLSQLASSPIYHYVHQAIAFCRSKMCNTPII